MLHVVRGIVDIRDVKAVMSGVSWRGEGAHRRSIVWDFRASNMGELALKDVLSAFELAAAYWRAPRRNQARTAAVAATPVQYGTLRQFGQMVEHLPREFDVFYDFDEAMAWVKEVRVTF